MKKAPYRAFRFVHPEADAGLAATARTPATADAGHGLGIAPTGGIEMAEGHESVRQAILLLLSTIPGERVMRPDYGCDLFRLIFSPNDDATAGLAIHFVRRAIQRWEPRVDVLFLDANRDELRPWVLDILLRYRVRSTQRVEEFHVPVDLAGESAVH